MHRPVFLAGTLLLVGCGGSAATEVAGPRSVDQRNVLFICLEDCAADALGCYGNERAHTPNIDRLAATGIRFDRAYCQMPACNPSRASFLTGLRPSTTGVLDNRKLFERALPAGRPTLPELIAPSFYSVAVGKLFHRSPPQLNALDKLVLWKAPAVETPAEARAQVGQPRPGPKFDRQAHVDRSDRYGPIDRPVSETQDFRWTRAASRELDELARSGQRFFLTLSSSLPHTPLLAPQPWLDRFPPDEMSMPPEWQSERGRGADLFVDHRPTVREVQEARAAYAACVGFVDAQIGVVLDRLEASGLADNTIVVLFADHGFHLGDKGYWGKYTVYEPATRVPLIVRVPGNQNQGKVATGIVELVDLLPTLCELTGIETDAEFEGLSFAPLLDDPTRAWKRAAFSQTPRGQGLVSGVRTERYRLIQWMSSQGRLRRELYDLDNDPWEVENLVGGEHAEAHREVLEQHLRLLETGWRAALPNGAR